MTPETDDVLDRLHRTGPEFEGWLSNHGPMATDAMARLGHGDKVSSWVESYLGRLEEAPPARWPIDPVAWRDALGDPSRLGDWLAFFEVEVQLRPWSEVVRQWWPRLLPGAVAAATHPLIRTGHAVRMLHEEITAIRLTELGQALAYWAARWVALPATTPGTLPVERVLHGLPGVLAEGGARTRLAALHADGRWARAASTAALTVDPDRVPAALDHLVDVAVNRYASWAPAQPTMLVHMATAPRAARLSLPGLPTDQWVATYWHAWTTCAAIAAMYRPGAAATDVVAPEVGDLEVSEIVADAVATGDEHAIKFAEVALESHRRGNPRALGAIAIATAHLRPPR